MAEPTLPASAGVVAVGVALLGPAAGPYAAIVLSSLAGALWALAAAPTDTRRAGAALLTVYGWCKDFGITAAYADHSLCSIEVEGLI